MKKAVVAVLYEYFYPGYRAGGPIQSLVNMIQVVGDWYDFKVITTAYDLNSDSPYDTVKLDSWNQVLLPGSNNVVEVWYSSSRRPSVGELARTLKQAAADVVYINGFYTRHFLVPLFMRRLGVLEKGQRIIISPRGMSQPAALAIKPRGKRLFLSSIKFLGLNQGVVFHATTKEEASDVRNLFGTGSKVLVAGNIPKKPQLLQGNSKTAGRLDLVYLSVITPKKNLLLLLQVLSKCKKEVRLDIYGPVKEEWYWQKCQKAMAALPAHVAARYHGVVEADAVQFVLGKYDAFALPTKGENFGHALYESLSVGTPIITSSFTPWQQLQERSAGWNIGIADRDMAVTSQLLDSLADLGQDAWSAYRAGAYQMAESYYYGQSFQKDYQRLFGHGEKEN